MPGSSARRRWQIRCAVCRCLRGAARSASSIASMKGIAGASRGRLRSGFWRRAGPASPNASRTIRRCTPSFLATPKTVPTPNSYSRRISSNSSTLALQSTATSAPGSRPQQSSRSFPRWAKSHDQSGPIQSIEIKAGDLYQVTYDSNLSPPVGTFDLELDPPLHLSLLSFDVVSTPSTPEVSVGVSENGVTFSPASSLALNGYRINAWLVPATVRFVLGGQAA